MHFLRENVTFYDAVNVIHDVITTANPIPDTAKLMFVEVKNNKTLKDKQNMYRVLPYIRNI